MEDLTSQLTADPQSPRRRMPDVELRMKRREDDQDPDYQRDRDSFPESLQQLSRSRGAMGIASRIERAVHREEHKGG